jgi:hypothetical protein
MTVMGWRGFRREHEFRRAMALWSNGSSLTSNRVTLAGNGPRKPPPVLAI